MRKHRFRHLLFIIVPLIMLLMGSLQSPANYEVHAQQNAVQSRGYLTTPAELVDIAQKAERGIEPYVSAVEHVLDWADEDWDFRLHSFEECEDADSPEWLDNRGGIPILYARALAYHLTGDESYAESVVEIIGDIISSVDAISLSEQRCRLIFAWGIPELIAAADLVAPQLDEHECVGPVELAYGTTDMGSGSCRTLFQNWLAKNPYYVISLAAEQSQSNWGAAATNALAYIADYLWDREEVVLIHRVPAFINEGVPLALTPAQAYIRANTLALARMNGYRVEYGSQDSCDFLSGSQQHDDWEPVKSQITELGIIPEEARRDQYCNIPVYNDRYQNYPQIHIGHNLQQCELMLRRGDPSCYDNITMTAHRDFTFIDPNGQTQTTHLKPGRGSLERAINAVIIDAGAEWRHDSALEVAYRYYFTHHRFEGVRRWYPELDRPSDCDQDVCFGTLTHGFATDETPSLPPVTSPP
ncbi:MAG: hypothetical protein L0154_21800 [Chloroflexi bacterium]|nr:hypothetical protein [Chloroflexota bacterium]